MTETTKKPETLIKESNGIIHFDDQGIPHIRSGLNGSVIAPYTILKKNLERSMIEHYNVTSSEASAFLRSLAHHGAMDSAFWADLFSDLSTQKIQSVALPVQQQEKANSNINKTLAVTALAGAAITLHQCSKEEPKEPAVPAQKTSHTERAPEANKPYVAQVLSFESELNKRSR